MPHTSSAATLVSALLAGCGSAAVGPALRSTADGGAPLIRRSPDAGVGSSDERATRGSIAGQVTLFGAASSAGVKVSLQPWGLLTVSGDSSGDFLLDGVPSGPYTLTFSAAGYASATLDDVLADGDAAFESVQLQRSVGLWLLEGREADGGVEDAIAWIGSPSGDGGGDMYALGGKTIYEIAPDQGHAWILSVSDEQTVPLGLTVGSAAFFAMGSPDGGNGLSIGAASQGVLSSIGAPGMIAETAVIVGERLFFATRPDAGWLRSWASVGPTDLWPLPELDEMLPGPPPVPFGPGLAGYRQQSSTCTQLMEFGSGAFQTLAGCLPFDPVQLDSSLDGQLVSAVWSPSGYSGVAFFDIQTYDGGSATLDGSFPNIYSRAVPLDSHTLYLTDLTGGISLWSAPDDLLYSAATLGQSLRPGGSFLAAVASDGAESSWLVTDNGRINLPFGAPWSSPTFSRDGRYAVFMGLPTLFDLVGAVEYPLVVDPAFACFNAGNDFALILSADGILASIDLAHLAPETSDGAQPVGTLLEGVAVTAAAFTPEGNAVIYGGVDPAGRQGIFSQPAR